MPRRITSGTSLENLKREAKRWLKALRGGDPSARARFESALPGGPADPTLRDVQHALAREYGLAGWTALRDRLAGTPTAGANEALVMRFLDNACPDHHVRGGPDHVRAQATAIRLLERDPGIARANFYTAVVCGDLETVRNRLAERPAWARERDGTATAERAGAGRNGDLLRKDLGPKGWDALLYLCFTRLALAEVNENAVEIARLLLDHGADPDTYFMAGSSRYTPLVGVAGEGEEERPPHPRRDALADLLLERGAEPYDQQVVYNLHFHGDVLWFLERIHERSLGLGRGADWDDPAWSMLDMGDYGSGARWHLGIAVRQGNVALAEWCLRHGADPNASPPRSPRLPQGSLYEEAVLRGHTAIADLLVQHGATVTPVVLDGLDAFVAASLRRDHEEVERLIAGHPEYLAAPEPLFAAVRADRDDVVRFLLDLGVSPDVENQAKERALHQAAYRNATRVAALLLERGAEVDPVESNWGNTPLGAAIYAQHIEMVDLLGRHSRDVWRLTFAGCLDRLREVLRDDPEAATVVAGGQSPLMWLPPADESLALEVASLLIAHGADPGLRDRDGVSPADRAERIGMYRVAAMLGRSSAR